MSKTMNATYRLQLSKDFTLHDLLPLVDYFHGLGISHLYLSPIMDSVPGSNHGYDGTDFETVSAERGGEAGLKALDAKLQSLDPPMKLLLDIVPNHMAADTTNRYWADVLANGPQSEFWSFFDIRAIDGAKIRLPVLGDSLDALIEKGDIKLGEKSGRTVIQYGENAFPLNDKSLEKIESKSLQEILAEQFYELANWQDDSNTVSYRRFFDVSSLIGLRVENAEIYQRTHAKLFDLIKKLPSFDGVRVDHIDGLIDPGAYLKQLARDAGQVWVEKILAHHEELPFEWPVMGTSGYEFIAYLNQVFTRPEGFAVIEDYWQKNIQPKWKNFHDCVTFSKKEVLNDLFSSELYRIAALSDPQDIDDAKLFWSQLTVELPVYRTYYYNDSLGKPDIGHIAQAAKAARLRNPSFSRLANKFLPRVLDPKTPQHKQALHEWQQLSGPVMAKGLEDTAHYRYTPLAALNEVGCEAALSRRDQYHYWQDSKNYPLSLKTTSTHDTKRSEDARHRLYALSEMPLEWVAFYEHAAKLNKNHVTGIEADTEYFLYQTILCAWPLDDAIDDSFKSRIWQYMEKAIRESKMKTSPLKQDGRYEQAVKDFTFQVLASRPFIKHAEKFSQRLMLCGAFNSLAVLALKILSPGVPDIYQGNEVWDFSLVDPDNRRKVDFTGNAALLEELKASQGSLARSLTENWRDGRIKLWLTKKLLEIRHNCQGHEFRLVPVEASGAKKDHVLAYHLVSEKETLLIVLARYPHALLAGARNLTVSGVDWQDTALLLEDSFLSLTGHDLMTGAILKGQDVTFLGRILDTLPIAVFRFQ